MTSAEILAPVVSLTAKNGGGTVVAGKRYETSEDRGPDGGFAKEWREVGKV